MVRKTLAFGLTAVILSSCGSTQVVKPSVSPLTLERKQVAGKNEKLIEEETVKPDWGSSPETVYAKPVWIPPVIRRIYIPPHVAPDRSLVAGYYVWKIVVPGRWRKPGEKVGDIPIYSRHRSPERKGQEARPQDAEAIMNFLKKYREKK